MIFTVDLLPTNQTLLSTENYGRTAQLSPHQARTAATSTTPPSTLGPFGPDGACSDGISESRVDAKRGDHFVQADFSLLIGSLCQTQLPVSPQFKSYREAARNRNADYGHFCVYIYFRPRYV